MPAAARTFVLVAGAWHGAWCWERLAPALAAAGHRVLMPELAGTGSSDADPTSITLDRWAGDVARLCADAASPVTLVGHSRGGLVISRVAELAPDAVQRLVYVAAYLLSPRGRVADAARADPDSLVAANMIAAEPGVSCVMRPGTERDAFYTDCDDETARWACERLRPEPLKPLVTRLHITPERFGRVPRTYVECTRDRAIGLAAQRHMQAQWPCDPVFTLDTGHSPFLSRPAELAELLGSL